MDTEEHSARERAAALNDEFRKQNPMTYTVTPGILDNLDLREVITRVREYDDFNKDNDPYGEHDFGSFELHGQKIFWKLSCYGDRKQGIDQLDPRCERVLTVMLAEEW